MSLTVTDAGEESGELIVRLAGGGDGATAGGRHVPLAAPGDRLTTEGALVPGPHHRQPPCRHFPECGGCQLQHVDDVAYADFLAGRIAGALAAQGIADVAMAPAVLSPPRTRRRATLHAERRGRTVLIGFNEEKSHRIVDMRECHVLRPELFALVAPLRALLATLLPDRRRGTVGMTLADQGVDLTLTGVEADGLAAAEALGAFAADHRLARLSLGEGEALQTRWEPVPATVTLGGTPVPPPPGAFLQATADGEAALVAAVRDAVGGAATMLDLFAGLGTFALALSASARVMAAEGERGAAAVLKSAAALAQRPVFVDHRDLFRRPFTTAEIARFAAVVLDPPRAGAKEQMPALAASGVPRIAYVSCNPATFARDARLLVDAGYRIARITPVGQFRWSTHVELVAAFAR